MLAAACLSAGVGQNDSYYLIAMRIVETSGPMRRNFLFFLLVVEILAERAVCTNEHVRIGPGMGVEM